LHGMERVIDPQDIIVDPRLWLRGSIGALSLVNEYVDPPVTDLDPQAFVILNGEYLDKRCWPYLLELRRNLNTIFGDDVVQDELPRRRPHGHRLSGG
jgi:hypothetical protein